MANNISYPNINIKVGQIQDGLLLINHLLSLFYFITCDVKLNITNIASLSDRLTSALLTVGFWYKITNDNFLSNPSIIFDGD